MAQSSSEPSSTQERFKRGAADSGQFFKYMAEFIGFTDEDAAAVRETRFIIEKYIPSIVAGFYAQLLRFPATRKHFLRKDGTVDRPYLEMRMHHQANFWRRAASGTYDDDFARFVDYAGRTHTSRGADPKIYIQERYVIGMVGYVQRRVNEALAAELHELDPEWEARASKAWNTLMMVILELLARSYSTEKDEESFTGNQKIDDEAMFQLATETYERGLGMARTIEYDLVFVARPEDIREGERHLVQVDDLSIGVFHHHGNWYALHNSCLHRGGPVCEGKLEGEVLTCPWHGYQYDLTSGQLLLDPSARLPMYPIEHREDGIYLRIPRLIRDEVDINLDSFVTELAATPTAPPLAQNAFRPNQLQPGQITLVHINGERVAVYNVDGTFYATQERCTHVGGPLSEGRLDGKLIVCPWHDSCFDVTDGHVECGPATEPVKTYRVIVEGDTAHVEE